MVQPQTDRIADADIWTNLFCSALRLRHVIDIGQMITARLDAAEGRAIRSRSIQSHFEEFVPIVCRDTIEHFGDSIKSVWLHLRRTAGSSIKSAAKVVEGFPALSFFAN